MTKEILCFTLPIAILLCSRANDEDQSAYDLPPLTVRAGGILVSKESIENLSGNSRLLELPGSSPSLAESIDSVAGVQMQRRGANALEPNVRGLGGDRIGLYWNGVYLPNASPTQTASPLNYFGPGSIDRVRIASSSAQVSLGPPYAGGSIDLLNEIELEDGVQGGLWVDGGRDGYSAFAEWNGAHPKTQYSFSANTVDLGDYTGGNGEVVDADFQSEGVSAMARHSVDSESELKLNTVFHRIKLSRNSSLPLDTRASELFAISLRQELKPGESGFSIRNRIGFSRSLPRLDNRDRLGAPILVEAKADTRSTTVGSLVEFSAADRFDVVAGADLIWESRDATRFRHTPKGVLQDRLWPDISSVDAGAFARSVYEVNDDCEFRVGARLGRRKSELGDAQAKALINGSLADNFIRYNDIEILDTERREWLGALNASLAMQAGEHMEATVGMAWARSAPSVTQRFRGFVNALGGGFELGNPALLAEESYRVDGRLDWNYSQARASLTVFHQRIDDYVNRAVVGTLGPNRVYGFRNVDGRFWGMELDAVLKPFGEASSMSVPIAIAIAEGENRGSGVRFADVPPLEGRAGLRIEPSGPESGWWGELDIRFAGRRSNPEPDLTPIFEDSASYATLELRGGVELSPYLQLEFTLSNALDKTYYHYLQPPVTSGSIQPSSGTLSPGDRIPAAGRSLLLSLNWKR